MILDRVSTKELYNRYYLTKKLIAEDIEKT